MPALPAQWAASGGGAAARPPTAPAGAAASRLSWAVALLIRDSRRSCEKHKPPHVLPDQLRKMAALRAAGNPCPWTCPAEHQPKGLLVRAGPSVPKPQVPEGHMCRCCVCCCAGQVLSRLVAVAEELNKAQAVIEIRSRLRRERKR